MRFLVRDDTHGLAGLCHRKPFCLERYSLVMPIICSQSRTIDGGLLQSLGVLLNSIFDQNGPFPNLCLTRRSFRAIYP